MGEEIAILAEHVSMHFNMSAEKIESLKEYVLKLLKRQLFFRDFVAVDDLSLEIKKGEVFGIVGTNGSGKSTLLKMISGILKPTFGRIEAHGTIAPLIELGAGFDGDLTARENIYLNGAVLGYDKPFLDAHFDRIVDFAELRDFLDVPIKNYSSGMVARIAFAIATIVKPDILIVDEILSVGDFLFQQKCERRIRELMAGGTTVVIVSHSIDQIESLCDRALWIEKSRMRMVGTAFEVCRAYRGLQNEGEAARERTLETAAEGVCHLCGKPTRFQVEPGVSLKREGACAHCAASVRNSDLAGVLLREALGLDGDAGLSGALGALSGLRILNLAAGGRLHNLLRGLPGYRSVSSPDTVFSGGGPLPEPDGSFDLILSEDLFAFVPDAGRAADEVRRLLADGGAHLFTVPLHEGRATVFRQKGVREVLRGDPIRGDGCLVTVDWGDDLPDFMAAHGLPTERFDCHRFYEPSEITDVDAGYEECLRVHPFYYYRYNSVVFLSRKEEGRVKA